MSKARASSENTISCFLGLYINKELSNFFSNFTMASSTPQKARRTRSSWPNLPDEVESQVRWYGMTAWAIWTLKTKYNYQQADIKRVLEKIPRPFTPWAEEGEVRPKQKVLRLKNPDTEEADPNVRRSRRLAGEKAPEPAPTPTPTPTPRKLVVHPIEPDDEDVPPAPPAPPTPRRRRRAARRISSAEEEDDTPPAPPAPPAPAPRPHRYRPGAVALREIRRYQKSTDRLIPYVRFKAIVKRMSRKLSKVKKWQKTAVEALQEASEQYIIKILEDTNWCAVHAGRQTIQRRDLELVMRIRGGR